MAIAKIECTFGSIAFSGEGEEQWLAAQLDKVISAAPTLSQLKVPDAAPGMGVGEAGSSPADKSFSDSLGSYLKAKGADANQTKRFLATSDWLRRRGTEALTTSLVTKALSDNHQKRLSNPADCLNKNVTKGFCEKKAGGYFITPDGLKELGHTQ